MMRPFTPDVEVILTCTYSPAAGSYVSPPTSDRPSELPLSPAESEAEVAAVDGRSTRPDVTLAMMALGTPAACFVKDDFPFATVVAVLDALSNSSRRVTFFSAALALALAFLANLLFSTNAARVSSSEGEDCLVGWLRVGFVGSSDCPLTFLIARRSSRSSGEVSLDCWVDCHLVGFAGSHLAGFTGSSGGSSSFTVAKDVNESSGVVASAPMGSVGVG